MNLPDNLILGNGEEIVRLVRVHWLTVAPSLVGIIFIFLAPFFFLWPLMQFGPVGLSAFVIVVFAAIFFGAREYRRWQKSVLILTTARFLWTEQRGFFDKKVSEAYYQNVQDVSYRIKGLWAALAHFGSLTIQVAGSLAPLELPNLPRPDDLQHLILELKERKIASQLGDQAEWWEDRLMSMNENERRTFFKKIQGELGEEQWLNLFRQDSENNKSTK